MKRFLPVLLVFVLLSSNAYFVKAKQERRLSIGQNILSHPVGIAIFDGLVYVTDDVLNTCFVFSMSDGRLIKSKGTFNLRLSSPKDIEVSDLGEVFIADSENSRIVVSNTSLDFLREVGGLDKKYLEKPVDVCFRNGILWVLDQQKRQVLKFDRFGNPLGSFGKPGTGKGELAYPSAIWATSDKVYVADAGQNIVKVFNYNGSELSFFGSAGTQPGSLACPTDIKIDEFDNIYIIDKNNHDLVMYPATNLPTTFFGRFGKITRPINWFHSDSVETDFEIESPGILNNPTCLDFDNNCVYITDTENARILIESRKIIWQTPRLADLPFQTQIPDTPSYIIVPQILDMGSVDVLDYREILIKSTANQDNTGFAYFENTSAFTALPSVFRGSEVTVRIIPKKSSGPFSGRLVIKIGNELFRIPIRGTFDKVPSFAFANESPKMITLSENQNKHTFKLYPQNGFIDTIDLKVTQPKFKAGWVKPAKGVDDVTLTTLQVELDSNSITLSQDFSFDIHLNTIGRLRPGFYTFQIDAFSQKSKELYASTTCSLKIENQAEYQRLGTVLFETFTAHWCNNCGFHREAQYRLAHEYSLRRIQPIAMNTLDENDLEVTGMTQPENYDRFKMYDGTGVPLSILNGEIVTASSTTDSPFAADRIKGRKYSGSSFEYWKLRSSFDSVQKAHPMQMNVSGEFDGESGSAMLWYELPDEIDASGLNAYFAIVQDNIFYYSDNGEKEHHFVVRQFIKDDTSQTYTHQLQKSSNHYNFNFKTRKMPTNFEIIPDDCILVCFVQSRNTKQILGVARCFLGSPILSKIELFAEKSTIHSLPGGTQSIKLYIANVGTQNELIDISAVAQEQITPSLSEQKIIVPVGSTKTVALTIQVPTNFPVGSKAKLTITVRNSKNQTTTKELFISSVQL